MTGRPLDPADWDEFRALARRMVDDLVDQLASVDERPVWRPVPDEARAALDLPVPRTGMPAEQVYDDFLRHVRPYPRGNEHPRFWGWVNGSGLPLGILADLLASGMNASAGAFENAATLVEEQVLRWLTELLDFPAGTSGVLTSGTSTSTVLGLATACQAGAGVDVRRQGVAAAGPLAVYASAEAHGSVEKACVLLGLGSDRLRVVPVDGEHRMSVPALARLVAADRRAGVRPLAVVATAGTVNTGAVDPLDPIADLCAAEGVWLHVDGAFGALGWLVPELRPRLAGLQRADSLAFDLHKWPYLPADLGCLLVRDADTHLRAFVHEADYLDSMSAWGRPATVYADRGIELTRRFRALKAWMCLRHHGSDELAAAIRRNVQQAAHLEALVRAHPRLELLAAGDLSVVCFRSCGGGPDLDTLNREILSRLWTGGVALVSDTRVRGVFALRAAITNHRTQLADLDLLVTEVDRLGRELAGRGGPLR